MLFLKSYKQNWHYLFFFLKEAKTLDNFFSLLLSVQWFTHIFLSISKRYSISCQFKKNFTLSYGPDQICQTPVMAKISKVLLYPSNVSVQTPQVHPVISHLLVNIPVSKALISPEISQSNSFSLDLFWSFFLIILLWTQTKQTIILTPIPHYCLWINHYSVSIQVFYTAIRKTTTTTQQIQTL